MNQIPVTQIRPSPFQPRRVFDEAALCELADSIRRQGLLQPIVVRPLGEGWELIAGERRWRAAQRAGLETIPAVVREVSDTEVEQLALIENIARSNLTPLEEAEAYRRLTERGLTVEAIAHQLSKEVREIRYKLNLLNLRPEYQEALRLGILSLPQASDLARLPTDRQGTVFRMLRNGMGSHHLARTVSALLEEQCELPGTAEAQEAQRVASRFTGVLRQIAATLGRCYSSRNVELLGWVFDGQIEMNLELVRLLEKQLKQIEGALLRAKARQETRDDRAISA